MLFIIDIHCNVWVWRGGCVVFRLWRPVAHLIFTLPFQHGEIHFKNIAKRDLNSIVRSFKYQVKGCFYNHILWSEIFGQSPHQNISHGEGTQMENWFSYSQSIKQACSSWIVNTPAQWDLRDVISEDGFIPVKSALLWKQVQWNLYKMKPLDKKNSEALGSQPHGVC